MSRDIQDEKELPGFPLPLISIHQNRITPCFPHETLQLMPLESCRAGELVHGSLQTRGAITPVSTRPNSSFLPVLFFFPLNFFFSVLCVPSTSLSISLLAPGLFQTAKEAEMTPSFYLCFQKNANQETQPQKLGLERASSPLQNISPLIYSNQPLRPFLLPRQLFLINCCVPGTSWLIPNFSALKQNTNVQLT